MALFYFLGFCQLHVQETRATTRFHLSQAPERIQPEARFNSLLSLLPLAGAYYCACSQILRFGGPGITFGPFLLPLTLRAPLRWRAGLPLSWHIPFHVLTSLFPHPIVPICVLSICPAQNSEWLAGGLTISQIKAREWFCSHIWN